MTLGSTFQQCRFVNQCLDSLPVAGRRTQSANSFWGLGFRAPRLMRPNMGVSEHRGPYSRRNRHSKMPLLLERNRWRTSEDSSQRQSYTYESTLNSRILIMKDTKIGYL